MFDRTAQYREKQRTRRDRLRAIGFAVFAVSILGVASGVLTGSGAMFEIGITVFFVLAFMWNLFAKDGASKILFVLSNWVPGFAAYALVLENWLETPVKRHSTGVQSDV